MEFIYLLIFILLGTLIFWFRKKIKFINLNLTLLGICSLIGWIFSASLLLFILDNIITITWTPVYSWIIGPILEEIVKFIVIYTIISTSKKEGLNIITWLAIGILVWLWFGIYENFIYINNWLDNIWIILFRAILVWWLLLHPLTSWIYGYMVTLSQHSKDFLPSVFKWVKTKFKSFWDIPDLVRHIYKNSGKSSFVILDFFYRILVLDVTIKYILWWKKKMSSLYWHSPLEICYEWLLLWLWIHILYNSILTYIWLIDWNITLQIFIIVISFILYSLFKIIYKSKRIAIIIILIIFMWSHIAFPKSEQLLLLSLMIIIFTLFILSWNLNKRINE